MSLRQRLSSFPPRLLILATTVLAFTAADAELDPATHFFMYGELVGERNLQLGDPQDWSTSLEGLTGQTVSGKLAVQPTAFLDGDNNALLLTWDKQGVKGQFAIYGPTIDLSPYEDIGALVFEVYIKRLSRKPVMLGMDCHYPCRSEFDIRPNLRRYPRDEWATMAVPVNCFTMRGGADGFDLSNINGPFLLSTEGRMEIAIANIRLGLLPEGDPGCR